MVVQGVAGSDKSSIALHRLASLLYNHRAALKNILVLGPSRIFLDYLGNILPSLGEHNVPHKTFAAWLVEKLGKPVAHYPQEHLLERLLDPNIAHLEKSALHRNALNKGSLRMAALIERYVDALQQRVFRDKQPLVCHVRLRQRRNTGGDPVTIETSAERSTKAIQAHLAKLRDLPFNHRKAELERRLTAELTSEMMGLAIDQLRAHGISPFMFMYDEKEVRRNVQERVTRRVHDYFAGWVAQNPVIAYRRLFRTPALLIQTGRRIFSPQDVELLARYRPKARAPFEYGDLAPLVYLKILLDGPEPGRERAGGRAKSARSARSARFARPASPLYDHLVVDEAQDISPLYLRILEKYSRTSSITLLGDLAQGVYTENAINEWDDLMTGSPASNIRNIRRDTVKQSYRSTREIIEYANDMLRRTGTDERQFAEQVGRIGAKPQIHRFQSRATLRTELLRIIKQERYAGRSSLTLVCKTAAACRLLASELDTAPVSDYQLTS